ncbi:MAG: hypothetical protein O3C10_08310, partial [Chloroflexi bacterium]|nr:hypothetical protein [Chloroflexota bacterium]
MRFKTLVVLLVGVAALAACTGGLDESQVDERVDSAITTAIAGLPTIFNSPLSAVRAQSFEAIDADGNIRAQIAVTEDGNGRMFLFDSNGAIRAALGPTADGSSFVDLTDPSGVTRGRLVVNPDGQPEVRLFDEQGGTRLGFSLLSTGAATVSLTDEVGVIRAGFTLRDTGEVELNLANGAGARQALLCQGRRKNVPLRRSKSGPPPATRR